MSLQSHPPDQQPHGASLAAEGATAESAIWGCPRESRPLFRPRQTGRPVRLVAPPSPAASAFRAPTPAQGPTGRARCPHPQSDNRRRRRPCESRGCDRDSAEEARLSHRRQRPDRCCQPNANPFGRSGFRRDGQCLVWGREPTAGRDPKRTFSDPHAPLYDTFNLQPHLLRRPPLRQLRTDAYQALAAASAAA